MSIPVGLARIWLLNFFGNAILLVGAYAWLSIGDANAAQLAGTFIYGVWIAFLALWLYAGTFVWFSVTPQDRIRAAFARALGTLAPFALVVVAAAVTYWLFTRAEDRLYNAAASAASWLTLKLRHPVKPVTLVHAFRWILRVLEWCGAPLILVPIASNVAERNWNGFDAERFTALHRRRWYALACPALLIAALFLPWLLVHWVPPVNGFALQTLSVLLRFGTALAIFVTAWLGLARVTARPSSQ